MAITNGYATSAEFKAYLGISDVYDDTLLDNCVTDASRWVENFCARRFYADTVASARSYAPPLDDPVIYIDDFVISAGITVADNGTTLASTRYQVDDAIGIQAPKEAWPGTSVRLLGTIWTTPTWPGQATVTVTAKWGWPSVPGPVKRATLMQAAFLYQSKDTRLGVAGFDTGLVRLRDNSQAATILAPYVRTDTKLGIA